MFEFVVIFLMCFFPKSVHIFVKSVHIVFQIRAHFSSTWSEATLNAPQAFLCPRPCPILSPGGGPGPGAICPKFVPSGWSALYARDVGGGVRGGAAPPAKIRAYFSYDVI